METIDELIGARIGSLIKNVGYSWQDITKVLDISKATYYNLLSGEQSWRFKDLVKLSAALGEPLENIIKIDKEDFNQISHEVHSALAEREALVVAEATAKYKTAKKKK